MRWSWEIRSVSLAAPAGVLARDLIAAGEIGEILAVDIHDKGGRPVGNTLMEMATHYFDEARFLLSGRVLADGRPADTLEWLYARLSTGPRGHPMVGGQSIVDSHTYFNSR